MGPQIPRALLHNMEQLVSTGGYDYADGGQWSKTGGTRIPFQGVILPVGNEDLMYAPAGTYTKDSRKLYTNGHALDVGTQVCDLKDGSTYTVKQELTHEPIHGMKQFAVECKKRSGPK